MFHLIVSAAFGDHARGERIEDQAKVAEILASENENKVIKVAAPAPAPAPVVVPEPAPVVVERVAAERAAE